MRRLKPEVLHFTYYEALPGGGARSVFDPSVCPYDFSK